MSSASHHAKRPVHWRRRFAFLQRFIAWPMRSFLQRLTDDQGSDAISEDFSKRPEALAFPNTSLATDIEAQGTRAARKPIPSRGAEYSVESRIKFIHLTTWFFLNLSLTLYNKALLQGFAFPWLLTTIHTSFVSIGCYVLLLQGYFKLTTLGESQRNSLAVFSLLFTANIAMSNISLAAVSIPFHQIMRSTTPIITVLIYKSFYSRAYSRSTYLAIIPIVLGVGLATYGDYSFTLAGLLLTLLGVTLAAVKTVLTNTLMTGDLSLPAVEILLRMSPLATLQSVIFALVTGEARKFLVFAEAGHLHWTLCLWLAGNGIIAFLLNISSFQTNKVAGALTMTVAGNLKQCLAILLGVLVFDVKVGILNGTGMLITVLGAAWYRVVELDTKRKQ